MKQAKRVNDLKHVGIIMDGNGRWARENNKSKYNGHKSGANTALEIIKEASVQKLDYLTLYAFSSENWERPKEEVNNLIELLSQYLNKDLNKLHEYNIRLRVIGKLDNFSGNIKERIEKAELETKDNSSLTLVLALGYGGRQEIIDGINNIITDINEGGLDSSTRFSKESFRDFLYLPELPDLDLIIRTSGEQRLSNFLMWQSPYSELYFPEKYWPEFSRSDFISALEWYRERTRNFGSRAEAKNKGEDNE